MVKKLSLPDDVLVFEYIDNKKSIEALSKEYNCSPCAISNHLKANGVKFRNPGGHHRKGKHVSEETRKRMSESKRGKPCPWMMGERNVMKQPDIREKWRHAIDDPAYRAKIGSKGSSNPRWKGGIAFLPYCQKFNGEFKERIREKFGRKCTICAKTEANNGERLTVHHIDYNKNSICNGKEWAFVALCHRCHTKTNYRRWYWFNLLINYWAMNPDINFGAV